MGDGRVGGPDAFEYDYRTTLAREDRDEFSLSGFSAAADAASGRGVGEEERADSSSSCLSLPVGTHCKSLVWSWDGKRLLAGVSTNIVLLVEYSPDDR